MQQAPQIVFIAEPNLTFGSRFLRHFVPAEVEVNMDNKKNESMEERAKKEELVVMLHSIRKVAEAHNESHTISHIDRLLSEMNDR